MAFRSRDLTERLSQFDGRTRVKQHRCNTESDRLEISAPYSAGGSMKSFCRIFVNPPGLS
jgi:hypothetical protein